jgi:hypothetical protein
MTVIHLIDPPSEDTLYWAGRYTSRGWRVVPTHRLVDGKCTCGKKNCGNAGKHPALYQWQKLATTDMEEAKRWFDERPNCNLSIVTGNGLVVLDVDGKAGEHTLQDLEREYGNLPLGPRQRTGGGGWHIFFKSSLTFKNKTKFLPNLDIRGENGQVVSCPSIHKSGNRYTWEGFDLDVPDMPEWLEEIVTGERSYNFNFSKWLKEMAGSVAGKAGNAKLVVVTHHAISQARIRDEKEFLKAVAPWNERCEPRWSEEELRRVFNNLLTKHVASGKLDVNIKNRQFDTEGLQAVITNDPLFEHCFQLNKLTEKVLYKGVPLSATELRRIQVELCTRYDVKSVDKNDLRDAIMLAAADAAFHPVQDYLEALVWDGVPRVERLASEILGAEDCPLYRAYMKRWCIAAVSRALRPGNKMDDCLVLYGAQGIGKSTFCRILASAGDEWFRDTAINVDNKDTYQQLLTWIYEWPELEANKERDKEGSKVKALLSSQEDNFRPPYGREVVANPRRCVIVGTTNKEQILTDPTGNRRFWIIRCGENRINREQLLQWRDQIWAEATFLFKKGERWHLVGEEEVWRDEANKDHEDRDPLEVAASEALENVGERITLEELKQLLGKAGVYNYHIDKPLLNALRREFTSAQLRVEGKRRKIWVRKKIHQPA